MRTINEIQGDLTLKLIEYIKQQISCFKSEKSKAGASQIDKLSLGGRIAALEELLAVINVEQDNRSLTPEILTAAGWEKGGDTSLYVFYTLTLDENFDYDTNFYAYIQLAIGKRDNCLKLDIERTLGDSIHATFRHQITVGEFNTLLEIVKLQKFQIK